MKIILSIHEGVSLERALELVLWYERKGLKELGVKNNYRIGKNGNYYVVYKHPKGKYWSVSDMFDTEEEIL